MFRWVKKLFKSENEMDIIKCSGNLTEFGQNLAMVRLKNEVGLRRLENAAKGLERRREREVDMAVNQSSSSRDKKLSLGRVVMIDQLIAGLDSQIDVMHKNIKLVQTNIDRINVIKAVQQAEVSSADTDAISLIFQEYFDKYQQSIDSGEAGEKHNVSLLTMKSDEELGKLEKSLIDLKEDYQTIEEIDDFQIPENTVLTDKDREALKKLEREVLQEEEILELEEYE